MKTSEMTDRQPRLRTNLSAPVYAEFLDGLLRSNPTLISAGLINSRYQEGSVRVAAGRPAQDVILRREIAVGHSLFGPTGLTPAMTIHADDSRGPWQSADLTGDQVAYSLRPHRDRLILLVSSAALHPERPLALDLPEALFRQEIRLADALHAHPEVIAGALIDLDSGAILEPYARSDSGCGERANDRLAKALAAVQPNTSDRGRLHNDLPSIAIRNAAIDYPGERVFWARIPFAPDHLLMLATPIETERRAALGAIRDGQAAIIRRWIAGLLDYGIETIGQPHTLSQANVLRVISALKRMDDDDLLGRLTLRGFTNHPLDISEQPQRCEHCIYYLSRSRWCDLPELPLPVEPHWWCRLWTPWREGGSDI